MQFLTIYPNSKRLFIQNNEKKIIYIYLLMYYPTEQQITISIKFLIKKKLQKSQLSFFLLEAIHYTKCITNLIKLKLNV